VPSRLTITKLKAFLIIDIILFGVISGAYFYLQDQGLVAVGLKPAEFTLSNLTIDPAEIYPGEAILMSVNITNVGEVEGNQTLNLEINDVIKDTANITLAGGASEIIEFTYIETEVGDYSVKLGDLVGAFSVKPAPPETSKIILSDLTVDPYEVWVTEPVTVTAVAHNPITEADRLTVRLIVDEITVQSKVIELDAGATQTVEFTFNASGEEGRHIAKLNTLSGPFTIVKTGYHTLIINRSGGGGKSLPFTLNGEDYGTVFNQLMPVGEYTISVPTPYDIGTGVVEFRYWSDGVTTPTRTFTLDSRMALVVTYELVSGFASCPSLFVWNGTAYVYIAEISNSGYLGMVEYIDADGNFVFEGGNPWDYIKLYNYPVPRAEGYFDMVLTQQWDEIFYVDAAYMMVVDHPEGVDVYTTMTNYINHVHNDQVYTVNTTSMISPVNATYVWAPKGTATTEENVLSQLSKLDGVFTPGNRGSYSQAWNNMSLNQLTIDLGNLSDAEQIKLVINGMVDFGDYEPYISWIDSFKTAADQGLLTEDTPVTPAPWVEVKYPNGSWIRPPREQQFPLPGDYVPRNFVVDVTDLFPEGTTDFQIRIFNFYNITLDYIGIDLSPQENITVQKITPQATLTQFWETNSTSYGSFTRYGDVTPLMQNADDMFVIGRHGDQILLRYSTANLSAPAEGMVREYFLVTASYFKDIPGEWGFGWETFDVDPLPFFNMSGYPYLDSESYPYDAEHLAYLEEYNTRIISPP
jgi:hypothetical protein